MKCVRGDAVKLKGQIIRVFAMKSLDISDIMVVENKTKKHVALLENYLKKEDVYGRFKSNYDMDICQRNRGTI